MGGLDETVNTKAPSMGLWAPEGPANVGFLLLLLPRAMSLPVQGNDTRATQFLHVSGGRGHEEWF